MSTVTGTTAPPRPGSPWAVLAACLAVIAAAVVGLFTQAETADTLVYSYSRTAGETSVYAMTLAVTLTPQGIPGATGPVKETVKARMNLKVLDVADDGSSTIELKLTDVSVQGAQAATSLPDYQNMTTKMRVSKTGEVLSMEGSSFAGFDPTELLGSVPGGRSNSTIGSSNNLFPVFPSEAIGPGDTWTESGDYPLPFGTDKVRVTIAGKHLGFVDSKYGRAARMNVKATTPLDFAISFKDILDTVGEAATQGEPIPPGLDRARMVMDGLTRADMTAQVLPNGGDLVKMVLITKMNVAMRFENFPPELAGQAPPSFRMVGDIVMHLDRVA
jgi:hypothetical protein